MSQVEEVVHRSGEGRQVARTCNPSGMFTTPQNGGDVVEGPHCPQPHEWYASVVVRDEIVSAKRIK